LVNRKSKSLTALRAKTHGCFLDRNLEKAGLDGTKIEGYRQEFLSHLDVAMEVLSGRVDAASASGLWQDCRITILFPFAGRDTIFLFQRSISLNRGGQLFLGLLHEPEFRDIAQKLDGYNLSLCSKIVLPKESKTNQKE